jgi:hypothetical protein
MSMPKNVMCKNCNNLKHHWCEAVLDSPDEDMLRDCRHFWQKTNADRIRAMSDEELAEDFCKTVLGVMNQLGVVNTGSVEDAVRKRLEWLKQEVDHE